MQFSGKYKIFVKTLADALLFTLMVQANDTIADVKAQIEDKCTCPHGWRCNTDNLHLTFGSKLLSDGIPLSRYNVGPKSVVRASRLTRPYLAAFANGGKTEETLGVI